MRALRQAIPEPDPKLTRVKRGTELRSVDIPSLLAIPAGCPFHPRCSIAVPGRCDTERPDLTAVSGRTSHSAACVRLADVPRENAAHRSAQRGGRRSMTVNEIARAALPIAVFFTVIPGLLLLAETPGTAGFVITVCTLVLGIIFLAIILIALHFPRPANRSAEGTAWPTEGTE